MLNFQVSTNATQDQQVIKIDGDIDIHTIASLSRSLSNIIEQSPKQLIADLSSVSYIDSTGLGVFAHSAEQLLKNNGKLFILTHSERIIKTFEVSGLTKHHITLIQSVSDFNLEDEL